MLAVVLITLFSSVSCGADTQGIRISDGVWSGTVIPDTVPAENVQSENVIVTEPPDDTGTVTDAVISSDESEPVTMPDTHPDESAPETETAPADTAVDDTTAPLPRNDRRAGNGQSAGDDESSRDKGSGDDKSSGKRPPRRRRPISHRRQTERPAPYTGLRAERSGTRRTSARLFPARSI